MSIKSLLVLPLLLAALQAASEDDLTFTPNGNNEYSVSDCDPSASGILDIPHAYNGKPVASIGNSELVSWTTGDVSIIQIRLVAEAGKKFFRFKMTD